jgi:hypothetical protein
MEQCNNSQREQQSHDGELLDPQRRAGCGSIRPGDAINTLPAPDRRASRS